MQIGTEADRRRWAGLELASLKRARRAWDDTLEPRIRADERQCVAREIEAVADGAIRPDHADLLRACAQQLLATPVV